MPAPLRTEQRVREDLGPGKHSSAAPPEPDSAETSSEEQKNCGRVKKFLPDARRRRTLPSRVAHGNQCWGMPPIKADRKPGGEARLQKNWSRRSRPSENHDPASANMISIENALDILHPVASSLGVGKNPAVGPTQPAALALPGPRNRLPGEDRAKDPPTPLSAWRTGSAYGHPSVRTSCALSDANRGS